VSFVDKEKFFEEFNNGLHRIGRIAMIAMVAILVSVPFLFGAMNNLSPDWKAVLNGILRVGIIYYPVSFVEFLIYTPMLGVGGSYLSFITGNITNMRIPCAMNAATIAKTEPGTAEHEIVNTIAVATSAITTTLVIVSGVVALVPLQPVLQNPVLQPAFDNVVPALFGALGLKYFSKSLKLSIPPLVVMSALCIFVPSLITQTSTMMIPVGALALALGYLLWKKDML
jgi:hypothetical protein